MKRWWACALLLSMFCGACGLPIPSGTTAVRRISGPQPADETDPVKRIPAQPFQGELPEAILQGFLAAGNEPDVARLYLTAANTWTPTYSTTVFTGDPVVKTAPAAGGLQAGSATISPILLINEDGSTQVPDPKPLQFTLRKENGEWRIATLPQGTELQQSDLASSFRRGSLGWLSPDGKSLVRESVLLPDPESLIPNLVAALIVGPSLPLTTAGVTSAVPSRWSADPPNLIGSQLSVGLHTNGADLVAANLAEIRAQFAATLLSPEVTSIELTLNGQPLPAGTAAGSVITAGDETSFDRDLSGFSLTGYLATPGSIAPLTLPASFSMGAAGAGRPTSQAATARSSATAVPGKSSRPTPSGSPSVQPRSTLNPGVPISAFAVSLDGQRFAELREVKGGQLQPVQIDLGSSVAELLGPPRDYMSVAWGTDGTLWLATHAGEVYMALQNHQPQRVPQPSTPLRDLIIAPDGVHAVGISTAGTLFGGLVSDGTNGTTLGITNLTQIAPSLGNITAVAVVGSSVAGLSLAVAGTQSVNPLVAHSAGVPVSGLWRVSSGAPDPTDAAIEMLSETVAPATASPCTGQGITIFGLVARPTSVVLAECSDLSLEAFDTRQGPLDQQWVRVGMGLAGYPLG